MLREVILEDKSIYMVFEYAEHDFLVRLLSSHFTPPSDVLTESHTSPLSNATLLYI